jgi:hypothetical protein
MKTIRVTSSEFLSGMQQWSDGIQAEFKSYIWLGRAQTLPLQEVFRKDEFGRLCAGLIMQKLKEYKR